MDFACYECPENFMDLDKAIKHLKDIHSIKDKVCKIKCLVNFGGRDGCTRDYLSFKAMKSHAIICVKKRQSLTDNVVITNND